MFNKYMIQYGKHPSQFGVLRIPSNLKSLPVIILIHGGFWQSKYNLEENNPMAEDLTRRGYATWNIEYRRIGEEGGGWTGTFDDVIDAVNHLEVMKESFSLNLSKVIVIGHSAGGHLALWLGARKNHVIMDEIFKELMVPLQKVISLAGVTDLEKMWEIHEQMGLNLVAPLLAGTPQDVPIHYALTSPISLLPLKVEQVLIHGELDRHVPVELSRNYYEKSLAISDMIKLNILPNVEHFKIIDPSSEAWESVVASIS